MFCELSKFFTLLIYEKAYSLAESSSYCYSKLLFDDYGPSILLIIYLWMII
jgi:hypothetical protein